MTKITFGSAATVDVTKKRGNQKTASRRDGVKDVGLESNTFTTYAPEVKFENIKAQVNVVRVKDDDPDGNVGVAKGALLEGVPICMPTNTAAATMQAMKKRCDYAPQLETMESFQLGYAELMTKIPALAEIRVDQELIESYLADCKPSKAECLRNAMLEGVWKFDGDTKHVFAKQEVLLKEHRAQPRVVYQGTDMYNLLTGCVVMELTRRMKAVHSLANPLNTGNKVLFACGMSGEELGDIVDQAKGNAVESDAKNNDGSQSAEFRKPEAMYYRKLGAPMWFVREFAKNTSVRVWTRYGVAATVKGERWSGEGTTTTGNSFIHMVLILASLLKAQVTESTNVHGGDDYLGFVEADTEEFKGAIESVYKDAGMVAEVVPQPNRDVATFYRKRYPRTNKSRRPVPQFGRVLSKLNLRANRNTEIGDREYMAGKYLSAAYEHRFVPEIKDILLSTSEKLSAAPHIDWKDTKIRGMGPEAVAETVRNSDAIPDESLIGFLDTVYGITMADLIDVYSRVSQSCIDYCDGWTYVDSKTQKSKNKRGNSRYQPTYAGGAIVGALLACDT